MTEHKQALTMTNRELLTLCGVLSVENFDASVIHLVTNMGDLLVSGENLHISHLDLEQGQIGIHGVINSLEYKKVKDKNNNLLKRLLK